MDELTTDQNLKEIFIDDDLNPKKVAIYENSFLTEFLCKLGPEVPEIGSVYIARIHQVFKQHKLATAELDNGTMISVRLSNKKFCSGELVVVTISSEPWDNKPARATLGAQIAGRYIILFPGNPDIMRVSNRGAADKLGISLKKEILEQVPKNYGVIFRRQALKSEAKNIKHEIDLLLSDWENNAVFPVNLNVITKPTKLYQGISLTKKAEIIAASSKFKIKQSASDWQPVYEQLVKACDSKFITSQQAVLWFQTTKGLTAIDIDSAGSKMGAFELSLHLSEVIMQQIRLRQISGTVFVDIPRLSKSEKIKFQQSCKNYALYDIRHPDIHGFGPAGLLEMTVSRRHMPLMNRMKLCHF